MKDELYARLLGVDGFAAHLTSFGVPTRRLAPDVLDAGLLSRDRHLIELQGSPIALVSLRFEGSTSIFDPLGPSFAFSLGPLPMYGRQVVPMTLHFVVRHLPKQGMNSTAELQFPRTGPFQQRDRSRPGFVGGPLAAALNADAPLLQAIRESVETSEALQVKVDARLSVTRIILARKTTVELQLLAERPLQVDRRLLPEPLFRSLERIAVRIQQS